MHLGIFDVLGLKLAAVDHKFVIGKIEEKIAAKKSFLISLLASQTFVLAYHNRKFRNMLNKYDYLFSDSIWVKRTVNFLYNIGLKVRLRGSNFLLQVAELSEKNKYRVYLYGTTADTLLKLKLNLLRKFPKLKIVGSNPSVFRNLSISEKKDLINEIESKKTDLLLLALGSPLEQIFAYELLYKNPALKKPLVIIPFGAAFDFTAGVKAVAPVWMQQWGIEWFFRLLTEPKRLWKRYLVFGPLFILLVLKQKIYHLFYFSNYKIIERVRRSQNI